MDMKTGQVIGVEALLRWHDSSFGTVPPLQIIEIAELTGLIQPLTNWIIDQALQQCVTWKGSGIDLTVSINLSVHSLRDTDLVNYVHSKLGEYAACTSSLCFEITESAMMANPALGVEVLSRLNEMGARLAIDDFGTGFSSLAYLKQLPVHELKIDKSFIFNIETNEDDRIIVSSTIDLAHNLGLQVVAEGVETQEIWETLIEMDCNIAQGHYLSRPLAPADLERWLVKQSTPQISVL
jgi:EAL domain-containing protein (putative c-di-GMP-specific phosphodiesterase class I)